MALDEFLPTSFGSSRSRPSTPSATPGLGAATPPTPAQTSSHKAPARVHRDFGKFSQQNRGIAIKMMEKMGYKMGEGLGSRGQGIVNPIEVKARPEKMGLAYKGRSERTAQSIQDEHKRKRAERRAAAGRDGDETGSDSSTSSTSVRPKASSGTKPARRKPKVVFQSVDEVIQRVEARLQGQSVTSEPAAAPALAKPATILDMTGPEVRERDLGSLRSATPRAAGPDIGITGPSVEEDIRLIIDLCLADMSSQDQERRIQQHRLKALAQERTGIEDSLITTETEIDALETMIQATISCEALARQVTQVPPEERQAMFGKLVDAVVDLHDRYASRWRDFDLEGFVTGVLAGPLATVLADWSPLAEPQFLQSALRRIRMAMTTHDYLYPPNTADPASAASSGDGPPAEWRHRLGTLSDHQFPSPGWSADEAQQRLLILDSLRKKDTRMTPYEALMYQSWLPRVRSALVNDWPIDRTGQPTSSPTTVKAANESALQLVETWRPPLIPQYLFHHLVDHAVLPKLANAVDAYVPDRGTGHIHQWLHPWLPLLGK
ncbi:hypothetical protein IWQ60_005254 [Tieghemiomyces parasiticus]|uniref:G-patch domain-containing protein n=1 Tax=Tieghemiomyces parasiticus TaxID=78921 RepID=A0A9W8AC52_9FUNG|nr:hypothetical protein IWQ60_005254 [Tieghemiomyces parasiticus]